MYDFLVLFSASVLQTSWGGEDSELRMNEKTRRANFEVETRQVSTLSLISLYGSFPLVGTGRPIEL